MKRIIVICIFTLASLSCMSQYEYRFHELINECLIRLCDNTQASPKFYSNIETRNFPAHFEFDSTLTKFGVNFVTVSTRFRKDRRFFSKERIVLFFDGLDIKGNEIVIAFSDRSEIYKNNKKDRRKDKKSFRALGVGSKMFYVEVVSRYYFYYQYDCAKNEWKYLKLVIN